MRGAARIAPILECVEGGVESAIEALRFSRDDECARAFLQKHDSVPLADLEYLSVDEVCIAAGVDPKRLLTLAVDWLVKTSVMKAQIELYGNLPKVTRAMVKNALTDKGLRDRRLVFLMTGLLPVPKDWSTPFALRKAAAQQIEKRPSGQSCDTETAPAALPWQSKTDERRG